VGVQRIAKHTQTDIMLHSVQKIRIISRKALVQSHLKSLHGTFTHSIKEHRTRQLYWDKEPFGYTHYNRLHV